MSSKEYPKVLIIGSPFNKINGGGITMSNLFYEWPKEKLALASVSNIRESADFSICENYYQLSYNGKLHPFPLNIILPKIKTGQVENQKQILLTENQTVQSGKYKWIYDVLYKTLVFTGLYNFLYSLKLNTDFSEWVKAYNPDIIYTQLASLEAIRFVSSLYNLTHKPIAVHIMDDWPVSINKPSILYYYWKKRIDKEFRDLISISKILMSICQGMSDEYNVRYKRIFTPFHNPIEMEKWLTFTKKNWSTDGKFKILYTGRIGVANGKSIILIAKVIDELNRKNLNFAIDIFSPDYKSREAKKMNSLNGVNISKTVENKLMPELLKNYDLLFLPLDFDERSVDFARFSMPTKASEYMISGVPVLVFADNRTFLVQHAINNKWAYVVNENSRNELKNAVLRLSSDIELRSEIAKEAVTYARNNEDATIIREKFRDCLILNK